MNQSHNNNTTQHNKQREVKMSMSKKDYKLVAGVMRKRVHYASYDYDTLFVVEMTIEGLSNAFALANHRFDRVKFSRACWCPCERCNDLDS